MNKKILWIMTAAVGVVVLVGGAYLLQTSEHKKYEALAAFAQCINESGATFYGAFWCPHCQDQKGMFNTFFEGAAEKLPYVECSTPDTNGQLQVCNDARIDSYPTWDFSNGTREEKVLSLKELSEATSCPMP